MQGKGTRSKDHEEPKEKDSAPELTEAEREWESIINRIRKTLWDPTRKKPPNLRNALHAALMLRLEIDGVKRKEEFEGILPVGMAMWSAIDERPPKEVTPLVSDASRLNNLFIDALKKAGNMKEADELAARADGVLKNLKK